MTSPSCPPGLIRRYREALELHHDARRTVASYEQWLRLMEALRPRIKDVDLEQHCITVRCGKDRRTLLPESLISGLQDLLLKVRRMRQHDLAAGWGGVVLPYALARKYSNAEREWAWQWLFPQQTRWHNRAAGSQGRHHLGPSVVQKELKRAVAGSGVTKAANCHRFRHS